MSELRGTSSSERTLDERDLAALRPAGMSRSRKRHQPKSILREVSNGIVCFCGERFGEQQAIEFMLHLRAEVGEFLGYAVEWHERNKQLKRERAREYHRENYAQNKEEWNARRRARYAANREQRRAAARARWANDPEFRERHNRRRQQRRAAKMLAASMNTQG